MSVPRCDDVGVDDWPGRAAWENVNHPLIAYEDSDLLVAVKPAGMSIESEGRDEAADLLTAMRGPVGADSAPRYLRVQQHMDRDISGLVVWTKTPDATRKMASAPGDSVETTFLATVRLSGRRDFAGELQGWWVKRGNQNAVRPRKTAGGIELRAELRTRERRADCAMVQIRTTCGGRQVRALLAAHGMPVVGDVVRGGELAHRVMLHAERIRLQQPATGRVLELAGPEPWEFRGWLEGRGAAYGAEQFDAVLRQAAALRSGVLSREVQAFRLFHGEGEGLPGVDVDRFGDFAVLWIDEQIPDELRARLVEATWGLGPRGVYLKVRPRSASKLQQSREAWAPSLPVRGDAAPDELTVCEHGLPYLVRLGDGLATGLFLDQRHNRAWIRAQARGTTMLNLFAYTCAFTVAAAAGGAAATVSVDISARALETGRKNLQAAGLDASGHEMVQDDVLRWVRAASCKPRRFGLVVLDPPSFGTTKHGRFSAESDYAELAKGCAGLIDDGGGELLACTNHRGVQVKRLRGWLKAAVEGAGRRVRGMKELPAAPDFPVPLGGEPHMKAVRVWVEPR